VWRILIVAALAAVAALPLISTAALVEPAPAAAPPPDDEGHVDGGGALSYRAQTVAPTAGHVRALRAAFAHRHGIDVAIAPQPRRLREATHRGVLWALATFARGDGTTATERFSRRPHAAWRDLGATSAACPAVPPEVRSAWRLPSSCRSQPGSTEWRGPRPRGNAPGA
jgi:hypothetical protein